MLVLLKTIKKPSLTWGGGVGDSKYIWNRFFAYYFLIVSVKVHKENTEVKSKGKRALQICPLACVFNSAPFSFPSLGKYSGRYISCTTWSPCFRTEITRILVEIYTQKVASSIWRQTQKDAFLPRPLGPTLISLSTSYISFCVEEPWTSKASQAKEGFAGCGKSRSLAPRNWRKLPTWLVINSLNWQDVKMKVYKELMEAMAVPREF